MADSSRSFVHKLEGGALMVKTKVAMWAVLIAFVAGFLAHAYVTGRPAPDVPRFERSPSPSAGHR
jgi:hypothetical protein